MQDRGDESAESKMALEDERPLLSAVVMNTACEREPAGRREVRSRTLHDQVKGL